MSAILVTGAGGMLGQALAAAGAASATDVLGVTRAECDIADAEAVERALHRCAPAAVINAAAWTDVDGAESHVEGARAVNATGPGVLARACARHGVHLVHVSTDYVFPGDRPPDGDPYVESDATGPRSVYGATKLEGEHEVLAASPGHAVVRTAWLFGAGGRNFVDTMLRLAGERDEVAVVDDQVGCPTWTGHLAPALLDVAERRLGGVAHLAGGGRCTWRDLAVEVFAQEGLAMQVPAASTESTARPAPRPPFSVLGTERTDLPALAPWSEGVRGHLAARAAQREGVLR